MEIPALPEQHGRHCPRLRNRVVERPHQFLVVEDWLAFSKRCPTSVTGGGIEKVLCPTIRTVLYERHGSFPFRCMHMKKASTTRPIVSQKPSTLLGIFQASFIAPNVSCTVV